MSILVIDVGPRWFLVRFWQRQRPVTGAISLPEAPGVHSAAASG